MKIETLLKAQKYTGWAIVVLVLMQIGILMAGVVSVTGIVISGASIFILAWGINVRKRFFK